MQDDKPPSKRDKAVAARRRAILDAAIQCFIEFGYHQTGVREIAKRAGVSMGNLYNHFSGKRDVLKEIAALERAELEPFLEMLAKDAPAWDVLETFLPAYTRYLSDPESVILTLEITCEAMREPGIAELFMGSRTTLVEALADLLARGRTEGSMRELPNLEETAHLILETIEGSAFRHGIEDVPIKGVLQAQSDFVLAALAAR